MVSLVYRLKWLCKIESPEEYKQRAEIVSDQVLYWPIDMCIGL